jgi:hypothetical protein
LWFRKGTINEMSPTAFNAEIARRQTSFWSASLASTRFEMTGRSDRKNWRNCSPIFWSNGGGLVSATHDGAGFDVLFVTAPPGPIEIDPAASMVAVSRPDATLTGPSVTYTVSSDAGAVASPDARGLTFSTPTVTPGGGVIVTVVSPSWTSKGRPDGLPCSASRPRLRVRRAASVLGVERNQTSVSPTRSMLADPISTDDR